MNKSVVVLLAMLTIIFMAACSENVPESEKGDLVLTYEDSEPGIDAYLTRVFVNENFLRMDDGINGSGYMLYDRQKQIVYSVSHEDETILRLVSKKTTGRVKRTLKMDARKIEETDMPHVDGVKPQHFKLTVNGNVCASIIAVKGLHEKAVRALNEFRRMLVNTHLANLANTPEDMQNECFLAHNVVSPSRTLQFGLPIFEEDDKGMKHLLVDYKTNVKVDPAVYTLPEKYRFINQAGK